MNLKVVCYMSNLCLEYTNSLCIQCVMFDLSVSLVLV